MTGASAKTLRSVLGSHPPPAFGRLSQQDQARLAGLVQGALDRHEAAIDEAEANILRFVPGPLRGTVHKLLMGGR